LKHKFLILFFTVCITQNGLAKTTKVYPDAGAWNTFSISVSLNNKWTVLFTEELRIKENYTRLNLFYTNLGMEYKINKNLRTSLVYRWIDKYQDDNSFSFRHRLMWDVNAKLPISTKWAISYRHRLQMEFRDVSSDPNGKIPEWYSRNRVEGSYQINDKLGASLAAEFRYQIHNRRFESSEHTWHRMRFQGGVDYKLTNADKVGAYYLIQREFNINQPQRIFITGLEYSHRFKL
jgi:hypothetical protein